MKQFLARFIRNSCLRYWVDNHAIGRYELSAYCAVLAKEFSWAEKLNSMARQASAERAWSAIARFIIYLTFPVKSQKACSKRILDKAQHIRYSNWNLVFKVTSNVGLVGEKFCDL